MKDLLRNLFWDHLFIPLLQFLLVGTLVAVGIACLLFASHGPEEQFIETPSFDLTLSCDGGYSGASLGTYGAFVITKNTKPLALAEPMTELEFEKVMSDENRENLIDESSVEGNTVSIFRTTTSGRYSVVFSLATSPVKTRMVVHTSNEGEVYDLIGHMVIEGKH